MALISHPVRLIKGIGHKTQKVFVARNNFPEVTPCSRLYREVPSGRSAFLALQFTNG